MVVHTTVRLSKSREYGTSRANSNISNGLWVVMIYQCKFINFNKCATLVGNIDNGRGCSGHMTLAQTPDKRYI